MRNYCCTTDRRILVWMESCRKRQVLRPPPPADIGQVRRLRIWSVFLPIALLREGTVFGRRCSTCGEDSRLGGFFFCFIILA